MTVVRKHSCQAVTSGNSAQTCRYFGWIAWLLSLLVHLVSNVTFAFIIPLLSDQVYLLLLKVLILDGLMLIMSIALAICITMVMKQLELLQLIDDLLP